MEPTDVSLLTQEALEAEHLQLSTEIGRLSDRRELILRERERRAVAASAKARIGTMNETEKAALLKELTNA